MDIELEWQKELLLKYNSKEKTYELDLEPISEAAAGVYIFGRRHGKLFEALYVGKATTLRERIKAQLNNHKLMTHVWNAKTGKRIVMIGKFSPRPNQTAKACLPIAEKALIRYFVSNEHDLVNVRGKELRTMTFRPQACIESRTSPIIFRSRSRSVAVPPSMATASGHKLPPTFATGMHELAWIPAADRLHAARCRSYQ